MMKKRTKAQIATIIIFIIAVIFLFTFIGINISMVAAKKTNINNIADGVGLQLASQLGSMASALRHELEIYGNDNEKCTVNKELILGGAIIFLTIVAACVFPPSALFSWATLGIVSGLATGALTLTQGVKMQLSATSPGAVEMLKIKMQNLSPLQQVIELPVQGALFALVDDPAVTKDKFDMDQDKDTADSIPRFMKWYNLRLNAIPGIGSLVESFYNRGLTGLPTAGSFFIDENGRQLRFFITEDENMMVNKGEDAVRWWVDADGDGIRDLKLVHWFRDELPKMLSEMRKYGYGINVKVNYEYEAGAVGSEIQGAGAVGYEIQGIDDSGAEKYEDMVENTWISELEAFENVIVRGLYNIDLDMAVQGLDGWLSLLKNDKNDDSDWYTRLGYLRERATELKAKLEERRGQIHNCVSECKARSWGCWGDNCQNKAIPDCGSTYSCGTDEEPATCFTQWIGCCGPELNCGQLCNDAHCRPTYSESPPCAPDPNYEGSRNCCNTALHLEPYPYGSANYCSDNIIEVYNGHNAITVLDKFIDDIAELDESGNEIAGLRPLIKAFDDGVKEALNQSYERMHEAFYLWVDKVGSGTSGEQLVGHIVYAKTEGLDPKDGFGVPSPSTPWQSWRFGIIPRTCVSVNNQVGEFTLTVARFDEDTAKSGPLSRFWRFRFSKLFGAGRISAGDEDFVRSEAERFMNLINADSYAEVSDKATLRRILRDYGIVTTVRVHYGPGRTEKDQASVPAAEKNRDIYIIETSSGM